MIRSLADRTFQLRRLLQRPPRWLSLPAIHLVGLRSWRVISSSRSNAFFYLASAFSLCAKRPHGRNFWWVWRWPVGSRCCSQKSQWCFLKCMRKSRSIKVNEFSVDWQSPKFFFGCPTTIDLFMWGVTYRLFFIILSLPLLHWCQMRLFTLYLSTSLISFICHGQVSSIKLTHFLLAKISGPLLMNQFSSWQMITSIWYVLFSVSSSIQSSLLKSGQ